MIRTIIIDDEPSALSLLTTLLRKHCAEDIDILATGNSSGEGIQLIEQLQPELVFLDVEMPGMSGIDLVRKFSNPGFRVVFVTAYDGYALEAFRLSAVDYLLKPISSEDVIKVIQKVKNDLRNDIGKLSQKIEQLDKFLNTHAESKGLKIGIAMSDRIVFISFDKIIYCEASGHYTHIYLTEKEKLVSSKPLGEFESQLKSNKFFRIHHHYLINLNRIKEFQRNDGGYVVMENNIMLEVSQRRRRDFLDAIQGFVV